MTMTGFLWTGKIGAKIKHKQQRTETNLHDWWTWGLVDEDTVSLTPPPLEEDINLVKTNHFRSCEWRPQQVNSLFPNFLVMASLITQDLSDLKDLW